MPRRRSALIPSDQAHWLTISDNKRRLIRCQLLPAGTDAKQALQEELARWADLGWQMEGDLRYGFCFVRCGAERRLIKLSRTDPRLPPPGGHAFLAGAGSGTRERDRK
jgi:hypothetical protein